MPREERLCTECDLIQDETHALTVCRINADARSQHCDNLRLGLPELFEENGVVDAVRACYWLIKDFV